MKAEYNSIVDNIAWLLGINGQNISFWTDSWCREPFINLIKVDSNQLNDAKVANFIQLSQWNLDQNFVNNFPHLTQLIQQVTITNQDKQDELVWKHTNTGSLTLKEAFQFKSQHCQELSWAKLTWSKHIPRSKSLSLETDA